MAEIRILPATQEMIIAVKKRESYYSLMKKLEIVDFEFKPLFIAPHERPTWFQYPKEEFGKVYQCSECTCFVLGEAKKICPHCDAKMEGDAD